tara:strand:+ start:187 stop:525 length:339 start_codon:yes stop_codon:yes gene_type:complete
MSSESDLCNVQQLLETEISFLEKYSFYATQFKHIHLHRMTKDPPDDADMLLQEYYQHSYQVSSVIETRKNILGRIIQQVQLKCKHEWETDLIDIDPDTSQAIVYCKICEKTK